MKSIIVILDRTGIALGSVIGDGDQLQLVDREGKVVRENVSKKCTIKQMKDILIDRGMIA